MAVARGASLLALLAGCLPVSESVRNQDTIIKSYEVEASRSPGEIRLVTASTNERLELTAEQVVTCTRERKQVVKRYRETERTTDHGLHGVVYALGVIGVLGGGAVIADAELADTPDDRRIKIGDDLKASRAVGISAAAAGGLLLVVGIASSVAAADGRKLLGDIEETVPGSQTTAECDRQPAANTEIALALPGTPPPIIPLGRTDARGKLVVVWADVVGKLPPGARAEGELVAGALDALRGDAAIGKPLTSLAHVTGPAADPEAAWAAAVAANTPEAYLAYRDRFPTSPHAAEAVDRARAANARTALVRFDEALAAGNLDRAAEALATLRANSDPATIAAAQTRFDVARKTARIAAARQQLPALFAAVETAADPAAAFAEAKSAIDAIREADVDEAARAQVQLDELRKRAVARLLREGQDALARRDFAAGAKKFDLATTIAIDVAAVARARAAALATAIKTALRQGRSLARERRYDEAIAIADVLLGVAPGDKGVAAERAGWVAARDRHAKEEAERAAREAARAEREAAARARLEEQRQRAAEEKAAREAAAAAAREERRQREEAAKAKRLADAEARRRAAEEKRLAAEAERAQRRAEAAAKQQAAEQARLAAEAERARARAEEARRQAEEAQRRVEEARAGIPPRPAEPTRPLPPVGGGRVPPPRPATVPVPPANDLAEARRHFEQGVALYGTGDYSAALVEFEASYGLNAQPFVLKNIGLSQKALFRYAEAIATFEKYLASSKTFAPPDPQQTQQLIADMKALLADITVRVTPDGAQINIDGRPAGTAPLPNVVQLATGAHSIEASSEGYRPAKREVMVSAGIPLTVEMDLELIPTKGKVRITSAVPRATVSIDGKPVGVTPLEIELDAGGHRLEVAAPSYKRHRTELVVNAGQTREVSVPLDRDIPPKQPWYMNKYVWAGAAAVVVGGIIIGVAASGTEAPIDGTLGSGSSGVP